MKLSNWAQQQGIAYITAWRWCKQGRMPCYWEQMPTGTIIVYPDEQHVKPTYTYCRVSSHDKKDDLQRQKQRCSDFCLYNGWTINKQFSEVGSGMNDKRKQLLKLLDQKPGRLVVEHKDRLTRFGFNYLELLLHKLGWEVNVINRDEDDEQDLVKDLVSIITSFCCRLYGLRRGQNKAKDIVDKCNDPVN